MKRYLFSYGTLLPEHAPAEIAPVVRSLRRVGPGRVRGRLYDLGEYPGAVLSRTGPVIVGQIFELPNDPRILEKLDKYEGFDPGRPRGNLFVRKRRLVNSDTGRRVWCWIYVYNRPPGNAPSMAGDFSKVRARRSR